MTRLVDQRGRSHQVVAGNLDRRRRAQHGGVPQPQAGLQDGRAEASIDVAQHRRHRMAERRQQPLHRQPREAVEAGQRALHHRVAAAVDGIAVEIDRGLEQAVALTQGHQTRLDGRVVATVGTGRTPLEARQLGHLAAGGVAEAVADGAHQGRLEARPGIRRRDLVEAQQRRQRALPVAELAPQRVAAWAGVIHDGTPPRCSAAACCRSCW